MNGARGGGGAPPHSAWGAGSTAAQARVANALPSASVVGANQSGRPSASHPGGAAANPIGALPAGGSAANAAAEGPLYANSGGVGNHGNDMLMMLKKGMAEREAGSGGGGAGEGARLSTGIFDPSEFPSLGKDAGSGGGAVGGGGGGSAALSGLNGYANYSNLYSSNASYPSGGRSKLSEMVGMSEGLRPQPEDFPALAANGSAAGISRLSGGGGGGRGYDAVNDGGSVDLGMYSARYNSDGGRGTTLDQPPVNDASYDGAAADGGSASGATPAGGAGKSSTSGGGAGRAGDRSRPSLSSAAGVGGSSPSSATQYNSSRPVERGGGSSGGAGVAGRKTEGEDAYGIKELLRVMSPAPNSDAVLLSLGIDLTTLGLNLNSQGLLYESFDSPFGEPECHIPSCYFLQPPPLKPVHFTKFELETLFYIFYSMPQDALQIYAALALYEHDWRYHKDLKLWFTPAPGTSMSQGSYIYFDIKVWERRSFHDANRSFGQGFLSKDEIRSGRVS